MNNVRAYTDTELLKRVAMIEGFKGYPSDYWVIGIASNENGADMFDDKFYLFKGERFISVTSGTTNSGVYGLKNFRKWNNAGAFVIKLDQWIYDFWKTVDVVKGERIECKHKGRMRAWRQNKPCYHYRDNDGDKIAEQQGQLYFSMCGINFHTVTYKLVEFVRKWIGGWSVGCQVPNRTKDYYEILDKVNPYQDTVSYCILEEFDPKILH